MFPSCLSLNELLRLRRVCKPTRWISDDYLRSHRRSRDTVDIALSREVARVWNFHLPEAFLEEARSCYMRHPTSRFWLNNSPPEAAESKSIDSLFRSPAVHEFLDKYGSQVVAVHVWQMKIQLKRNEFNFYRRLPNLRKLGIYQLEQQLDTTEALSPQIQESFANLQYFYVQEAHPIDKQIFDDFLHNLVLFCSNLEYYIPPWLKRISTVCQIVKNRNLKKIGHANVLTSNPSEVDRALTQELFETMLNRKIVGEHANTDHPTFRANLRWREFPLKLYPFVWIISCLQIFEA